MEKSHVSIRRGVSWSPGGVRKPLPTTQDLDAPSTDCNASWENRGLKGQATPFQSTNQMARKTNLTRSASLSEKELKEARVRSQIIAAQLTIPSNSNSRGVQLFNRRKQRVNAFTLESCGERGVGDKAEDERTDSPCDSVTWAERSADEKDRELNSKNSAVRSPWSQTGRVPSIGDIMEEPSELIQEHEDIKDTVMQDRHFLPVNDKQEFEMELTTNKEELMDDYQGELGDKVRDEVTPENDDAGSGQFKPLQGVEGMQGVCVEAAPPEKLPNGCHGGAGSDGGSASLSKQPRPFINRTARPFFSPTTVQSPEASSPIPDAPPAPSYSTPPLPIFLASRPAAFSPPPPPPPSYPTPPLPAFTSQPPQSYTSPPPMSPVMSPPPGSHYPPTAPPGSHYIPPNPPVHHYGPPTAPRPSTFVPSQTTGERRPLAPIKTGILEEGAARRSSRKAMFTFKEKPVVAPNPELLSLVQGADERRKHGYRSVPEPASDEELLALGAEASNFLAEEVSTEEATAPEWSSCLKASRTRERAEHKPEQTLTNVSGKGAELFAKRQSRMEKYVVDKQNAGQVRSPSPTMSLPASWEYPSNMPGRVKALARNSEIMAQLSENLIAQQSVKRQPSRKAPPPAPAPAPEPPLENGCTKIEMDLSRHQPYQLKSSLFILNPVKDPMSSLPKGAPPPKPLITAQSFSRQSSLPNTPTPFYTSHAGHIPAMSPQPPVNPMGAVDYPPSHGAAPASRQQCLTSPGSAFSPRPVGSPRSNVQAPRPTFSAKKAGIAPQTKTEPSPPPTPRQTPTASRTPNFPRRFSSPDGPTATWSPSIQAGQPASTTSSPRPSLTSPIPPPWGSRSQSPVVSHITQPSPISSAPISRAPHTSTPTATATSPIPPPWGSRCQSPMVYQPSHPSPTAKSQHTSSIASPVSLSRESRCLSPGNSNLDTKANHRLLAKNIINAAKRKNSPSPGALSGHSLPISPLGGSQHGYDCSKPPFSPSHSRALGAQSPSFASPPPTPTQRICSPVRLYNTRSLTDSDASVESEDSGLRSPGLRSYNTCPRGWGGSLRVKRGSVSTDL